MAIETNTEAKFLLFYKDRFMIEDGPTSNFRTLKNSDHVPTKQRFVQS